MARDAPLIGRDAELDWLRDWAIRARAGRAGRVLVEGPPGIGKSSLIRMFADRSGDVVPVVVRAAPGGPPRDFLTRLGAALGVPPAELERDATSALLRAVGDRQDHGLLLLVLEDLHDLDDESVGPLVRLLRRLRHDQVLTLATARDEPVPRSWRSCFVEGVDAAIRRLDGLDGEAVATLARALRPGVWPPAALAGVAARTGGHPLHLVTVLPELPDDVVDGLRPLDTATSLREDIDTAVARLPEAAHTVLAALAVLDAPADRATVVRLTTLHPDLLDEALAPLVGAGLVVRGGPAGRPTIRIHHALQAESVRAALPFRDREALHRAAAAVLGGRAAFLHRLAAAAGRPDPELARDLERSAAAEPVEHGEAATRLLAAADVAPDGTEAVRLRLAAAVRLVEADDLDRLVPLHEDVRAAEPGPARSAVLGYLAGLEGDPAAVAYLESVVADDTAPSELRSIAGVRLAHEHAVRARGTEAIAVARTAAELTARSARREEARIFEAYGRAHEQGPAAGLRVVEPDAEAAVGGSPALVAGILHQLAGDVDAAHTWFRESLDRSRRQEDRTDAHEAHIYLAETLWRRGRWDLAAAQAEVALAWFADGHRASLEAAAHAVAVLVPASRGDEAEAGRHLAALQAAAARFPSQQAAYALATAGAVLARAVQPSRMLAALGDLPRRAERSGFHSAPFTPWRTLHAEALLEAGRTGQAAATIAAWPERGAPLWFDLTRHRLLARLADDAGDDAAATEAVRAGLDLARADEHTATRSCPVELAELRLVAGARLLRRGRTPRAAAYLEAARTTFVGLGAKPWIERVDGLGRDEDTGGPVERLTPRERQVASLVAEGMTSREVADELWVTPKAVDYHLGNVFRKLGLTSRRDLRGRRFPAGDPSE